uniref:Glycosyltransferase n=1 Tax=Streptococcus suis TaxID=1307 RepID=A0A2H4H6D6_STRSU|nr:glycosyltransferase [Streptococcus suis]
MTHLLLGKKTMKINVILPSIGTSGGIDVINKYVELLAERGHDVKIYKSFYQPNLYRYKTQLKNDIHRVYCTMKSLLSFKDDNNHFTSYVPRISDKYIRNADVIIATAWYTAYWVDELSVEKGKKFYFIQDFEIWDNKELGIKSYSLQLNKIVISSWIEEQIKGVINQSGFPKIINGVDGDFFVEKKDFNEKVSIECLMLNHSLAKKGVDYGLKSFERAKKSCPNLELTMFGMNDSSNLPDYVKYYQNPSHDLLRSLYEKSDIFIFPSLEEGWGLTPIEAMASKCAVVASNTGFVKDIGIDERNVLISDPKDYKKMSDNIVRLVNDRELFIKIAETGYKTVKEFSWNKCADKLEDLLVNEVMK